MSKASNARILRKVRDKDILNGIARRLKAFDTLPPESHKEVLDGLAEDIEHIGRKAVYTVIRTANSGSEQVRAACCLALIGNVSRRYAIAYVFVRRLMFTDESEVVRRAAIGNMAWLVASGDALATRALEDFIALSEANARLYIEVQATIDGWMLEHGQ